MTIDAEIERQARLLATENKDAEPTIEAVYWFPNDKEVLLIGLTPIVPVSQDGEIHPFYFRAEREDGLPSPSGVALIRPDEFGKLRLPDWWAPWSDAVRIDL